MKIEATLTRLRSLVAQMEADAGDTSSSKREQFGNGMLYISRDAEPDFDDLLDKFTSGPGWTDPFSVRALREQLLGAIDAAYDHREEAYLADMIQRLDEARPRTRVLVPLSGVVLGVGVTFDFGRVTLVQMNPEFFADELERRFPNEMHVSSQNETFSFSSDVKRDFDPNGLFATFTVNADARRRPSYLTAMSRPSVATQNVPPVAS